MSAPKLVKDWHHQRDTTEPPCWEDEWRTSDRKVVQKIKDMTDSELQKSIKLARANVRDHGRKLPALIWERSSR